jgi:hypothetical protein
MLGVVALALVNAAALIGFVIARARVPLSEWRLHEVLLLWQTLYWMGGVGVAITDPVPSNLLFGLLVSLAELSAVTAALLGVAARRADAGPSGATVLRPIEKWGAVGLGGVSALVCAAFTISVLRDESLALILAGVITGEGSFLEYRLTMYSGEATYLAPGYVKQFRDVLLPVAIVSLAAFERGPARWLVPVFAAAGAVASVLSGERFVIMVYVFTLGLAFALRPRASQRAKWVAPVLAGGGVFAAFVGATILLGRAEADQGPLGVLLGAAGALFDRVVMAVPRENAAGFSLWGPLAPTWGATWLADLSGVLPGVQAGLDHEIHDLLGGGSQGSSPLGMPADLYLAWGAIGVAALPLLYSLALQALDGALRGSSLAVARSLRFVLVPLTFAWYSPFLFILNGGVVLCAGAVLALLLPRR